MKVVKNGRPIKMTIWKGDDFIRTKIFLMIIYLLFIVYLIYTIGSLFILFIIFSIVLSILLLYPDLLINLFLKLFKKGGKDENNI
jgi:hypothetical protein